MELQQNNQTKRTFKSILDIHTMEIELNNVCNLNCPLCSRSSSNINPNDLQKRKELDFDDLKTFLLLFPKLESLNIVGNISEPTLYSQFIPFIEWCKSNNFRLLISSNMNTLTEDKWKIIGSILKEEDEFRIAIDGSTQRTYAKYRYNGNLYKAIRNSRALIQSTKCTVLLQYIRFQHNNHIYKEEIRELCLKLGLKQENVYSIITDNEDKNKDLLYPVTEENKQRIYFKILDRLIISQKNNPNEKTKELMSKINCYSSKGFIYLNHKGDLIPCCDRYEEFYNKKNLLNMKTVILSALNDSINVDVCSYFNEIYSEINSCETCIRHCHIIRQQLDNQEQHNQNNFLTFKK